MRRILCVVGPIASGKGTVVERLSAHHGAHVESWSSYEKERFWAMGVENPTREQYSEMVCEDCRTHGPEYLAQLFWERVQHLNGLIVADGPRWLEHISFLRGVEQTVQVWYLEAGVLVRWQRSRARARFPGDDVMSLETFLGMGMESTEVDVPLLRARANRVLVNETDCLTDLYCMVDACVVDQWC